MISKSCWDRIEPQAGRILQDLAEVNRVIRNLDKTKHRNTFMSPENFDAFIDRMKANKARLMARLDEICQIIDVKLLTRKIFEDAKN